MLLMKILGLKDGPVSQFSHGKLGFGNLGDFWRDGADSSQKVDTLAGRRVSSTPGKRLGEVMTHPYS